MREIIARVGRNADILPDHANHPGWKADGCLLRITVRAAERGTSSHGFACSWTGEHCIPSSACDRRRVDALALALEKPRED